MLDRSRPRRLEMDGGERPPSRPGSPRWRRVLTRARGIWSVFIRQFSSSLTRRIVVLNLAGLLTMLVGFLWLNQTREGLIDARVQSLLTQGEIIASAVAASATLEGDAITIDPEKLLQLQAGETSSAPDDGLSALEFSLNPERVAPVLRRLVAPARTRARLFDRDNVLLVDTQGLTFGADVLQQDLPPPDTEGTTLIERSWSTLKRRLGRMEMPIYDELAGSKTYPEVARALLGIPTTIVRVNAMGQTTVFVAVPIQRFRTTRGALLLSTQEGDVDAVITRERISILLVFLMAAGVILVLSMLLASTIAEPIRRLSAAAERVRRGGKSRYQIPDYTGRPDEIGHLSGTLRDMTKALYNRIEAIESFAADVTHELKNPLTSLRSAVETLPLARNDVSRARLMEVIQHDVRRLDRLISDISDASRLDAELARADAEPVDMVRLLKAVVTVATQIQHENGVTLRLDIRPGERGPDACFVIGHDSRLGQVFNNLIDNARSFSPPGDVVRVTCARQRGFVVITVDDNGPGIPSHAVDRIFERFYTDRPDQGFGQNSGLGLSISKQIVEAHRGTIVAQNRLATNGTDVLGARFVVRLPAAAV